MCRVRNVAKMPNIDTDSASLWQSSDMIAVVVLVLLLLLLLTPLRFMLLLTPAIACQWQCLED